MAAFLDNITRRFLSPKEQREIENEIPRYIDGNILLLNFAKRRYEQKGIYISLAEAENLIRNAQTIEPEALPIVVERRGHWEKPKNPFLNQSHFTEAKHWICSYCGYEAIRHQPPTYCERCGAKNE